MQLIRRCAFQFLVDKQSYRLINQLLYYDVVRFIGALVLLASNT